MIFAQLASEAGAAFIGGAVGDGESGDAGARAVRGLLGQVTVNDGCVHNFYFYCQFFPSCSGKLYATGHTASMGCIPNLIQKQRYGCSLAEKLNAGNRLFQGDWSRKKSARPVTGLVNTKLPPTVLIPLRILLQLPNAVRLVLTCKL